MFFLLEGELVCIQAFFKRAYYLTAISLLKFSPIIQIAQVRIIKKTFLKWAYHHQNRQSIGHRHKPENRTVTRPSSDLKECGHDAAMVASPSSFVFLDRIFPAFFAHWSATNL